MCDEKTRVQTPVPHGKNTVNTIIYLKIVI